MPGDVPPEFTHARAGRRGHGNDRGRPVWISQLRQLQRPADLGRGQPGRLLVGAVGLGDGHRVGQLQHPPLDHLEAVAAVGRGQHYKGVDHAVDHGLGLAHAHRLHQHHVIAGRLDHRDGLAGGGGHSPGGPSRGRGPDEGAVVGGQPGHPGLVAQDGAAGAGAGRVHGQHGHPPPPAGEHGAQRLDQRRLAHPGHPGDPHPVSPPGVGQQPPQQSGRGAAILQAGRLHQSDGPPQRGPVAGPNPGG